MMHKAAAALVVLLGAVGVHSEVTRRLQGRSFACSADFNVDGVVGVDDLLVLLANYGRETGDCGSSGTGGRYQPSDFNLPGKFVHVNNSLETDPRLDPRFLGAFRAIGMSGLPVDMGITLDSPREVIQGWTEAIEPGYQMAFNLVFYGAYGAAHPVNGVVREEASITGDGCYPSGCGEHPIDNSIPLFIHKPASHDPSAGDRLPCLVSVHGGGMTVLMANDTSYHYERDRQASAGMVVIGPEFRNAGGNFPGAPHLFPKGLHDVYSTVQWTHERREELGCSVVVTTGCSGGGNLALAVALQAKELGTVDMIDGVFGCAPYIAGPQAYNEITDDWFELPSLYENNHLFLDVGMLAGMSWVYTESQDDWTNSLAWPYWATPEQLSGLPPHYINVNELDPLRDEGLAYYRKLLNAGVDAVANTAVGTVHCGDLMPIVPDTMSHTMQNIKLFAERLALYRAACDDSCSSANDGVCQEEIGGGSACAPGTDETDCATLPNYSAVCKEIVELATGR